jgi:hypothetical protein
MTSRLRSTSGEPSDKSSSGKVFSINFSETHGLFVSAALVRNVGQPYFGVQALCENFTISAVVSPSYAKAESGRLRAKFQCVFADVSTGKQCP